METEQIKQNLIGFMVYQSPLYHTMEIAKPDTQDTMMPWLLENTFGDDVSYRFMLGIGGIYAEIHNQEVEAPARTAYYRQITVRWQPLIRGVPDELLEALVEKGYKPVESKT
ncbi:MAG TPA: hypothetical protein VJH20_02730 [Candidatus Nanoarchaeia archaeon]|nr:hypothetical protein [Candidatus Nanoarchaeia archaeon]